MKIREKFPDRFENISDNYGELFSEVFSEQGFNYQEFEKSILRNIEKIKPSFRNLAILDIGIGDGETSKPFIEAGCKKITGIDLNPKMIIAAKERFGDQIKLIQVDAIEMNFKTNEFPIIISGATIHNITKKDRKIFWRKIIEMSPEVFVSADKMAYAEPERYQESYNKEIEALKKVYGEKYHLPSVLEEWLDHYKYDEKEKLDIDEILDNIGGDYEMQVVYEAGMYKTIMAIKK